MSYINEVDNIITDLINDFHQNYLAKNELFDKLTKTDDFSDYHQQIVELLETYINRIDYSRVSQIISNAENLAQIVQIINRYIVYYFFLGLSFYYPGKIQTFRNNLITFSNLQKTSRFVIKNFFDVPNNAKLIALFKFIKNLRKFLLMSEVEINALDPTIFASELAFINTLGTDWIAQNLLIEIAEGSNIVVDVYPFGLIKTIVILEIYRKEERNEVLRIVNEENDADNEYMYIDILVVDDINMDFDTFRQYLSNVDDMNDALIKKMYQFILNGKFNFVSEDEEVKNVKLLQFPFIHPIIDDYLRYHREGERIENEFEQVLPFRKNVMPSLYLQQNKKKDNRRAQIIVNKNELISEYYSITDPDARRKIKEMFYPPLLYRKAVSINYIEELRVFNKMLVFGKSIMDNSDNYLEMSLLMQSAYQNFKDYPIDENGNRREGITLDVETDYVYDAVRYANIEYQNLRSSELIEVRALRSEVTLNILGFTLMPLNRQTVSSSSRSKLIDIRTIIFNYNKKTLATDNGLKLFLRIIKYFFVRSFTVEYSKGNLRLYHDIENLSKKNPELLDKVIYWLYNSKIDVYESEFYQHVSEQDQLKYLNAYVHDKIGKFLRDHLQNILIEHNYLPVIEMTRVVESYLLHFQFELSETEKQRMIIENYYQNKKPGEPIAPFEHANYELPIYHPVIPSHIYKIYIDAVNPLHPQKVKKLTIKEELQKAKVACEHDLQLRILKSKKDASTTFNEMMTAFIDTYAVQTNTNHEYLCRICSRVLPIYEFLIDGAYDNVQQRFVTSYIPSDQRLEDLKEYQKYTLLIRFWYRQIDQFCLSTETTIMLGSTAETMNKKKNLIKTMIDVFNAHSKRMLRKKNERHIGVDPNYSILTFFELDDSIIRADLGTNDAITLTSNKWKINNLYVYFILLFISELNGAQIATIFSDKVANIYNYEQYIKPLFQEIRLRKNTSDNLLVPLVNYPIMSYLLFVCGYLLLKYPKWYVVNSTRNNFHITNLRPIFHTTIDLLNSICDEYNTMSHTDPDYHAYSIFLVKIYEQINTLLKNNAIMQYYLNNHAKYVTQGKVLTAPNEIPVMKPSELEPLQPVPIYSSITMTKASFQDKLLIIIYFNLRTDADSFCPDGKIHDWPVKDKQKADSIICRLCGYDLTKHLDELNPPNMTDAVFYNGLQIVAEKRCIDGSFHIFEDDATECLHCHQPFGKKYSDPELLKMIHNIQTINYGNFDTLFEILRNIETTAEEDKKKYDGIINDLISGYRKLNKDIIYGGLNTVLKKWIDTLEEYLGTGMDLGLADTPIYIRDNVYIINHKFNGAPLEKPIILRESDGKMNFREKHPFFKRNVYWYQDKLNDIEVYYDAITLRLIGHREGQRNYAYVNIPNTYLQINWSIKDQFYYLGYTDTHLEIRRPNIITIPQPRLSENVVEENGPSDSLMNNDEFYSQMDNFIDDHLSKTSNSIHRILQIISAINLYENYKEPEVEETERQTRYSARILPLETERKLNELINKYFRKNINFKLPNDYMFVWNKMREYLEAIPVEWDKTSIDPTYDVDLRTISYYDVISNVLYYYMTMIFQEIFHLNPEKLVRTNFCQMFVEIVYYLFTLTFQKKHSLEIKRFDYLLGTDSDFTIDLLRRGQGLQSTKVLDQELENLEVDDQLDENATEEEILEKERAEEEQQGLDVEQEEWVEENEEEYQAGEEE